jgi:hypothetical protein
VIFAGAAFVSPESLKAMRDELEQWRDLSVSRSH